MAKQYNVHFKIKWNSASNPPDDDREILGWTGDDTEIVTFDGKHYLDDTGSPCKVDWWVEKPIPKKKCSRCGEYKMIDEVGKSYCKHCNYLFVRESQLRRRAI